MNRWKLAAGVLLLVGCSFALGPLFEATLDGVGLDPFSLPTPVQPPNVVQLSQAQQLGKDIFFDVTLSDPEGYACATCHVPSSGFTGPSSTVNQFMGPVPGVIEGRFGRRKPQAVTYSTFSPYGPYFDNGLQEWLGGNFWDGRAQDNAAQARMPFLDQNEMANTPVGPYPPHAGGFSPLVGEKLRAAPYRGLFQQVFGVYTVINATSEEMYTMATEAIAAYEASAEVNQFSSKYDASIYGVPATNSYELNPSEQNGLILFFGIAQCSQCHSASKLGSVLAATGGKETFTMYCYANIGVPRNPDNPFYHEAGFTADPFGFNAAGSEFIDYGIGANPNRAPDGTRFMRANPGDTPGFRGLFKAPSIRNVDKRPTPDFVKSYMHNGVFKSLKEVVHFYNKRNIAVDRFGNETAFDLRVGPPRGFTPLFPPPEVLDNVQNAAGLSPLSAEFICDECDVASNGQVGNLQLTSSEEDDIVNFLKTLTDGYTAPNPAPGGP